MGSRVEQQGAVVAAPNGVGRDDVQNKRVSEVSLNTGYFLSADASGLPFTQIRQCADGKPFAGLVEVDPSKPSHDHRYAADWAHMPVCSLEKVARIETR